MKFLENFKRSFRRRMVVFGVNKCVECAVKLIQWEKLMVKQDDCKHEGQAGIFCGLCGKGLKDPEVEEERGAIKNLIAEVLTEYGVIKPKTPDKPTRKSLAERLGKGKKT